jgi:hypothetical protein
LACNVFSFEAKASNNARADWRSTCSSSHGEQELDRDGDPPRGLDQRLVHDEPTTEDRGGDPGVGRRQRNADGGAQRDATAVADRRVCADLGQLLEGVQGRLPRAKSRSTTPFEEVSAVKRMRCCLSGVPCCGAPGDTYRPPVTKVRSTHVDTAFMGLTSSPDVTASRTLSTRARGRPPFSGSGAAEAVHAPAAADLE